MRWPELLVARRGRVRLRGARTLKTTFAAVAAYVVALPLSSNPQPVLAPLTALLVVQLTLYDTVRSGLRRVVSVVTGVLVAVVVAGFVPLDWRSLTVVVAGSLVLGRLLRLGAETLEVPISAMLVFAVGGSDVAAWGRVFESLIGAAVGIAVSVLIAPPLYVRPASDAVQNLARMTAEVIRRVARDVEAEYTREQAADWLDAARALGRDILRADRALAQAEDSLKLNPRAHTRRHAGASLRSGLDALERATISLRSICRTLADRAGGDVTEPVYAEDVRSALSDLLDDVADTVGAYGQLVGSEVSGRGPEDAALRAALEHAWEDRARLGDLLRQGDRLHTGSWELHGDLIANVDRLLRDLDSDARAELRQSWPRPRRRPRPVRAARSRLRRPTVPG